MRAVGMSVLMLALLAAIAVGTRYYPLVTPPARGKLLIQGTHVDRGKSKEPEPVVADFPRVNPPQPAEPRQTEPYAVQTRAKAIACARKAIEAECQNAAGGDWNKWEQDTACYRAALQRKVDALRTFDPPRTRHMDARSELLAGRDSFPLFEVEAKLHLNYLYDPAALDRFRKEQPVVAANHWLQQHGIDLIFVAVPKMTEVYIDHFLQECPADGIITPQVRRALLELLNNDVEVIDGLQLFRAVRDCDQEYLYNTCDTHWSPRGMRVMAKEIADRVCRYRFGMRARYALPIFQTEIGPYTLQGYRGGLCCDGGWLALSPEQQKLALAAQTTSQVHVLTHDGQAVNSDPVSLVIVTGNSYADYFCDQLSRELNLAVSRRWSRGMTTEYFSDFLREPDTLSNCRVIVWLTTNQHLTHFVELPAPVLAARTSGTSGK